MTIVIDASVAACWAMPDEKNEAADQALRFALEDPVFVPALFWYELKNILLTNERRGRITKRQSDEALIKIFALDMQLDVLQRPEAVDQLARRHMLTFYDASYLELALFRHSKLATLDRPLAIAGRKEQLNVIA